MGRVGRPRRHIRPVFDPARVHVQLPGGDRRGPLRAVERGRDGSTNYVEVLRTDGTRSRASFATNVELNRDDVIRIVTGNGGGFGPPEKRDAAAIRRDILNGYITPERAAAIYGWRE